MSAEVTVETYCDGLLRSCKQCREAREALQAMNKQLKGRIIIGTQPDEQYDHGLSKPNVPTYGPWRINCEDCKNTGLILTAKGRRLLGLLQVWLPEAMPAWLAITDSEVEQDNEIPF